MKSSSEVWEFIDAWILKNVRENESLVSKATGTDGEIKLQYYGISDNKTYAKSIYLEMALIRSLSDETVNLILRDLLEQLRENAEVV